jgi:fermentation-respiration switch protein FrsA (DUF1100 family)
MMQGERMCTMAKRVRDGLIKNLNAKTFVCKTKDNVSISGLYIERENPIGTIILCHGYRCCKELTAGYIDMFPEFNTVMFDFRAHGENKKGVTTIGCVEHKDVLAVIDWLKKNQPQLTKVPTVILGVSMGGAASLRAAENNPTLCDAIIVDSSFSSLQSVIENTFANKSGLPNFPFLPIMTTMFNFICNCEVAEMKPLESIKKIKQPLMLIHSCIDTLVPVQESLLMYAQAAKTGAKLWIAPQCKHGWLHKKYPELYKKKVFKFLKKRINLTA